MIFERLTVFARGAEPLAGNEEAVAGQRLSPSGECSHRSTPPRRRHSICYRRMVMYITAPMLRLSWQQESHPLVVQHHAVAPHAFDRRAFLKSGAFVIFAHVDVHEAVCRFGGVNMNVEV